MKKIYFNAMQSEVMTIGAKISVVKGGRGVGKGLVQAAWIWRNIQHMPGSTGGFIAPNAERAKTNMIPSIVCHWEEWGFKQGVHWDIGVRPKKSLGWAKPLFPPMSYENVISFYTGAYMQIISQDRPGTSNSKSFDWLAIDEAKFINYEKLKNETFQANRGQVQEFGECPWHHGMLITSDMPTTNKGSWFLKYEEQMNPELIKVILGLQTEIISLEAEIKKEAMDTPQWKVSEVRRLKKLVRECQKRAVYFGTYSSLTNLDVLGEDFIRQQLRDLPRQTFKTSILCEKPDGNDAGFYVAKRPHHLYTAAPTAYGKLMEGTVRKRDCRWDGDIIKTMPLYIGMDYNKHINCLVVGQPVEDEKRMNTLNNFWVKYKRRIPEVVNDFCDYYEFLPLHEVVFYWDHTAKVGNSAVNDEDYRWVVIHTFEKRGWKVHDIYIGKTMNQSKRHLTFTQGCRGEERLEPHFNKENCEDLLIAMDNAGVYNDGKDKRPEKLPETEESPLQHRTDITDAFDTLYIGCLFFPYRAYKLKISSNWAR